MGGERSEGHVVYGLALADLIEAEVDRNTVEPDGRRQVFWQSVEIFVEAEEDFLGDVFGVGVAAEHSPCGAEDKCLVSFNEAVEGIRRAGREEDFELCG